MKIKRNLIFIIGNLLLLVSLSVVAKPTDSVVLSKGESKLAYESEFYRNYIKDLLFELTHYDGINHSDVNVVKFEAALKAYLAGGSFEELKNNVPAKYKNIIELWLLQSRDGGTIKIHEITESSPVKSHDVASDVAHTIDDVEEYIANRIGPEMMKDGKNGEFSIRVHAGDAQNISTTFQEKNTRLVRLPSFYEDWGIEKYVDLNTINSGKPVVYINIPPIKEYADHYKSLLTIGGINGEVRVNQADRNKLIGQFNSEVESLTSDPRMPKGGHVAIGYEATLENIVESKQWNIVKDFETAKTNKLGLQAAVYTLTLKDDPSVVKKLTVYKASSTLWGEGTKFLSDAVLKGNPKSLTFMGSAGLLDINSANHYDASIPQNFVDANGNPIDVDNHIYNMQEHGANFREANNRVFWGGTHGHSSSPAEQNATWLARQARNNVSTIDVEVNLVAQAVAEHNANNVDNVRFGVINLVTDKVTTQDAGGPNLSAISSKDKEAGKTRIVRNYIDTIAASENAEDVYDQKLKDLILRSIPGLKGDQVSVKNGQGRIDASKENKVSYYVISDDPGDLKARISIIPMATSRYDRYNYHTDEWWDKYGADYSRGVRVPMESPEEVQRYLNANNLSVNPDVYVFDGVESTKKSVKLNDFLLEEYLKNYEKDGFITLYRGVSNADEVDTWKAGSPGRGARYWTPDINYAWRYARKKDGLLTGMINGQSTIPKFKIPREEFINMVKRKQIVLGTELPRSAHTSFNSRGVYIDSITGHSYMGNETYGVELEVRARRGARLAFPQFYAGTVGIEELAADRIEKIRAATLRDINRFPDNKIKLLEIMNERIANVDKETSVLLAASNGQPIPDVTITRAEITDSLAERDFIGTAKREAARIKGCRAQALTRALSSP